MKRKLFIALTLILVALGAWATPPQQPEKSEGERFVQGLAKIKSDEISYAYISANMFKQLFVKTNLNEEMQEAISFMRSLKRPDDQKMVVYKLPVWSLQGCLLL